MRLCPVFFFFDLQDVHYKIMFTQTSKVGGGGYFSIMVECT